MLETLQEMTRRVHVEVESFFMAETGPSVTVEVENISHSRKSAASQWLSRSDRIEENLGW